MAKRPKARPRPRPPAPAEGAGAVKDAVPPIEDARGWVCVGVVGRPKGLRGAVRVASHTERPEDIAAYGPLYDRPDGRSLVLTVREVAGRTVVATIEGVNDRAAAEALARTRLYLPRAALPAAGEETFYHADLLGLRVDRIDGACLGVVRAVHDFGAGDLIEIERPGGAGTLVLPFTRAMVPLVDIAGGRLVVAPDETEEDDEEGEAE